MPRVHLGIFARVAILLKVPDQIRVNTFIPSHIRVGRVVELRRQTAMQTMANHLHRRAVHVVHQMGICFPGG